jgi:primosomal protein N' (replication factor Y)
VGVVNADTILHQPDFRASERTFQLISQVSGRTGRGPRGGRVLVQTSAPDEPAIVLASKHDFANFVTQEWGHRQALLAPPCRQFTRIIIRGKDAEEVRDAAKRIAQLCTDAAKSNGLDVRVLGPAPAPVSRIKGQYRFHVMLAAPQGDAVRGLWRKVVSQLSPRENVEWTVDVDPINLR